MNCISHDKPARRQPRGRERTWRDNYARMEEFITANGHLPDKRHIENRELLNWWKYNRKRALAGLLDDERMRLLDRLSRMRRSHRGWPAPPHTAQNPRLPADKNGKRK